MGDQHWAWTTVGLVAWTETSMDPLSIAFLPKNGFPNADTLNDQNGSQMIAEGRRTFRFDTFGDEAFWGDTLQLHQAIQGAKFGGVGGGVSPKTALSVGLKVDVDALPAVVKDALAAHQVNLDDPATTLTLLQANAVVGVVGLGYLLERLRGQPGDARPGHLLRSAPGRRQPLPDRREERLRPLAFRE